MGQEGKGQNFWEGRKNKTRVEDDRQHQSKGDGRGKKAGTRGSTRHDEERQTPRAPRENSSAKMIETSISFSKDDDPIWMDDPSGRQFPALAFSQRGWRKSVGKYHGFALSAWNVDTNVDTRMDKGHSHQPRPPWKNGSGSCPCQCCSMVPLRYPLFLVHHQSRRHRESGAAKRD